MVSIGDGGTLAVVIWAEPAHAAARWLTYCGVLVAAGGAVFVSRIHDHRPEERATLGWIVVASALLGVVATVLTVPLHAIEISGAETLAGVGSRTVIASLESVVGTSALVRVAGLGILLAGLTTALRGGPSWVLMAGGAVALLSFLLAGHTVTAEPAWLAYVSNGVHVVAAAVWFGGLVMLGAALARRARGGSAVEGAALVARFSVWATGALALVTAGGLALAWVEMRTPRMITTTAYGRTLALKLVLVAVVMAMGAYNNRRLVPAVARVHDADGHGGGASAWRQLGLTVRLEAVGLIVVLAVTAVLVHTAPPRPYSEDPAEHGARDSRILALEALP